MFFLKGFGWIPEGPWLTQAYEISHFVLQHKICQSIIVQMLTIETTKRHPTVSAFSLVVYNHN